MKPLLYDFRRSLIRVSALVMLILFIAIGIGMSYSIVRELLEEPLFKQFYELIMVKLDLANRALVIRGGIYDPMLGPADGRIDIALVAPKRLYLGTYSVSGEFAIENTLNISGEDVELLSKTNVVILLVNTSIAIGRAANIDMRYTMNLYKLNSSIFGGCGFNDGKPIWRIGQTTPSIGSIGCLIHRFNVAESKLQIVLGLTDTSIVFPAKLYYNIEYAAFNASPYVRIVTPSTYTTPNLTNYRYFGTVYEYMKLYSFAIPIKPNGTSGTPLVNLVVLDANGVPIGMQTITVYDFIDIRTTIREVVLRGISAFAAFFPLVMLHLANVLMAKPRSSGALEFVLARPVTRLDIFMTRYLAGVFTGLTASAILVVAVGLGTNYLLSIPLSTSIGVSTWIYIYLGLAATLTAFYTLCYTIATTLKSGSYIAISIALYIALLIGHPIILSVLYLNLATNMPNLSYTKLVYISHYFNPLHLYDLITSLNLGTMPREVVDVIRADYISIATALWIAIPIIFAWLRFRVKDLT